MAIAIFNSIRGKTKKTCLILVKANLLVTLGAPVYVPTAGVAQFAKVDDVSTLKKGDSFEIPDGYTLVDIPAIDDKTGELMVDKDTGEMVPLTTKDGAPLKTLAY